LVSDDEREREREREREIVCERDDDEPRQQGAQLEGGSSERAGAGVLRFPILKTQ